jgi:hypothetical protein
MNAQNQLRFAAMQRLEQVRYVEPSRPAPEPRPMTDIGRAALALLATGRKPTVPEVQPLVEAYRALPGNIVGGSLHVVLDDGNVDDKSIGYCLNAAREDGDEDGAAIAQVLLRMSKTQRRKVH